MRARYNGHCDLCGEAISKGDLIRRGGSGWTHNGCFDNGTADDAEYWRGYHETKMAQMAGPVGSAAREAAYMELEQRWAREGFDY